MATTTTRTERTLADLIWEDADLISWWIRFQTRAPALAERLHNVRLITRDAAAAIGGGAAWVGAGTGYGAGWCYFAATPRPAALLCAALGASFQLRLHLAQSLTTIAQQIADSNSTHLADFTLSAAEACESWTVQDVEERLGMSLGRAYFQAGTVPLWSILGDPSWDTKRDYRPQDPYEFRQREPADFFFGCLEGVIHGDSFWTHYSRTLFGSVPRLA